jgi:hypothetical protein
LSRAAASAALGGAAALLACRPAREGTAKGLVAEAAEALSLQGACCPACEERSLLPDGLLTPLRLLLLLWGCSVAGGRRGGGSRRGGGCDGPCSAGAAALRDSAVTWGSPASRAAVLSPSGSSGTAPPPPRPLAAASPSVSAEDEVVEVAGPVARSPNEAAAAAAALRSRRRRRRSANASASAALSASSGAAQRKRGQEQGRSLHQLMPHNVGATSYPNTTASHHFSPATILGTRCHLLAPPHSPPAARTLSPRIPATAPSPLLRLPVTPRRVRPKPMVTPPNAPLDAGRSSSRPRGCDASRERSSEVQACAGTRKEHAHTHDTHVVSSAGMQALRVRWRACHAGFPACTEGDEQRLACSCLAVRRSRPPL